MLEIKDYMYKTGEEDKERLDILNEVYNPYAQELLSEQGLTEKRAILEIACGQGDLICWLAEQAPQAIVVGLDISKKQLDIAREKAEKKGLNNIYFIELSALDLDQLPDRLSVKFGVHDFRPDLTYSRWLLVHLKHDERAIVVRKAYNLLSKGGVSIHEEVTLKQSYTQSEAYKKWIDIFEALGSKIDVDFDLGDDLQDILSNAGYERVVTSNVKPEFYNNQLRFFNIDLRCTKDLLEKEGICSFSELQALEHEIATDLASGKQMTMVNVQAIGRRG